MNEKDTNKENPFTEDDVLAALEGYDSAWYTYPIEKMSYRSNIPLVSTKRNGRKQKDHIKMMNFVRDELNQNKTWNKVGNGRKLKKEIVEEWRKNHLDGKKIDCHRETGLSRVTIDKWW